MKTKAVRLYGKNDLRIETFELPAIKEDEILAKVVTNSVCMSDHKAAEQGADHKRVPADVATNPVIIGHEFCGQILEVGSKWQGKFTKGDKFSIQPALNYKGSLHAPGYSFQYVGGNSQYVVIPHQVMEMDCLLPFNGDAYFLGSLSEPISCIVGTYHAMYHTTNGSYVHKMEIKEGGNMALLAGVGPMGLGAIDYAIHNDIKPGLLVVTDIDDSRLNRAESLYSVEEAKKNGVKLVYLNTKNLADPIKSLRDYTDGAGYDDVILMAPVAPLVEQADRILGRDGCLNFFAGPNKPDFSAKFNFYDVHYASHHIVGTSGGNTDDMRQALSMMETGLIDPASLVTHVGGMNVVPDTIKNLPSIPGGKKLIYTHIEMPLVALADLPELGKTDPFYKDLGAIVKKHNDLWSPEAEKFLLKHFNVK